MDSFSATLIIKLIRILLKWKYKTKIMLFWPLCCECEAILFRTFRPDHRAGVFIWENFHPVTEISPCDLGRKNRDLSNRASPASHMNTSIRPSTGDLPFKRNENDRRKL